MDIETGAKARITTKSGIEYTGTVTQQDLYTLTISLDGEATDVTLDKTRIERISITPEVGMGATYAVGSDRYACTIVEVLYFKSGERKGQIRGVVAQDDTARVVSGSEQDGSARYECTPNTGAGRDVYLWNERTARYVLKGSSYVRLGLGHRTPYRDPSF